MPTTAGIAPLAIWCPKSFTSGRALPARHGYRINLVTDYHPRRALKDAAIKGVPLRKRVAAPRDGALQPCLHHHLIALHGIGAHCATAGGFECAGKAGGRVAQMWRPFAIDADRFGPVPDHSHVENRFLDNHPLCRYARKLKGGRIAGQKRQKNPKKAHRPFVPRYG